MDKAWEKCGCENGITNERLDSFYAHPVWILNGLFVEEHQESVANRKLFTEFVASQSPKRIADIGGGFGTLARMLGQRCPDAEVHVVEPHPHASAISLASETANVSYVQKLIGDYDVLLAIDVFEHVTDPLALVEKTAAHLRKEGVYLIRNDFCPVIKCHLPETFHFRWTWDRMMNSMNFASDQSVAYGRAYVRTGPVNALNARMLEQKSQQFFRIYKPLPMKLQWLASRLFNVMYR